MSNKYNYKLSSDFISKLEYNYFETYSFQRGDECILYHQELSKVPLLLDEDGKFHSSAQHTHTFNADDTIAEIINTILLTPANDIPAWMCAPIFRDGIVYYNKAHSVIACLNICFSCEYMMLNEYTYVNADAKVYTLLKELFISLGHEVNNDVTS